MSGSCASRFAKHIMDLIRLNVETIKNRFSNITLPMGLPYTVRDSGFVGYWGPVTSTIDWCEENYVVSSYFAEFFNATTNLSFFALSLHHLYSSIKNKHGWLFNFLAVGMGFVGLGSWLFHMSLQYEYQLMDELPMIYVTALPFAYIFAVDQSKYVAATIYLVTLTLTIGLTVVYIGFIRNPVLHEVSYAVLNLAIIARSIQLCKRYVPDKNARIHLYKLLALSLFEFLLGFFVWNVDTVCCSSLTKVKREVLGFPLGAALELHGWWHILTSAGIYHFVIYNELLNCWFLKKQDQYKLVWRWGVIAEVKLLEKSETNEKSTEVDDSNECDNSEENEKVEKKKN